MFVLKKETKSRFLFSLLMCSVLFVAPAFAEEQAKTVILTSNENKPVIAEETSVNTKNILPAIDLNSTGESKDKNIIPILELKGGVNKEHPSAIKSWLTGNYFSGDWMGLRTNLEEHGINLQANYIFDSFGKTRGGLTNKNHSSVYGLLDSTLTIDTEKLHLIKGGIIGTRFQVKHGNGLSNDFVGDYQGYDNYDGDKIVQLSEYWYEQRLFKDYLKVKIGKQDANNDFCALSSGFNMMNSSFSFMPNIPLPSYPIQALGVVTTISPTDWLSFRHGVFDGESKINSLGFNTAFNGKGNIFNIEEIAVTPTIKGYRGKYMVGLWNHSGNTDEITASDQVKTYNQNYGNYVGFEQMIYKENKDCDDDQGATILGQYSWAPVNRNEIPIYYGLGLQYKGLIPKRNNDVFLTGVAIAKLNPRLRDIDERRGCETAYDTSYKIQLTPWCALQPDMQVIFHPNGQEKTAWLLGLRTLFTF
ncbi:MAG: carbohydrate porin [bacterium]